MAGRLVVVYNSTTNGKDGITSNNAIPASIHKEVISAMKNAQLNMPATANIANPSIISMLTSILFTSR
ncbi:hypothetical protein [Chitinophaga sp. Cy-1792]|uniref:hypothetical protein n=1 Tax=Chitinophaga sp. Cy-1792 TaxID=2608339 RepID=UPI00141F0A45|nr:hypothetical protein [Chitinophaga sp. Cy-1792]NIG53723.1 hypothetical protein [Chitinophaga sp. Cy-1792]